MNRNIILTVTAVIFLSSPLIASKQSSAKPNLTSIVGIEPRYAANFSDDRVLMGASHNVFVGKVLKQIGVKERGIGPETQFAVLIISNIKGNLNGIVKVDQQGGYEGKILYIIKNDLSGQGEVASLLHEGNTYLLATRYNAREGWYTLNSFPTASKLITDNGSLNLPHIASLVASDPRVKQLIAAYPSEIAFPPDILHNSARNSYQTLHPIQAVQMEIGASTSSQPLPTSSPPTP